jgi:hypothetical protein
MAVRNPGLRRELRVRNDPRNAMRSRVVVKCDRTSEGAPAPTLSP